MRGAFPLLTVLFWDFTQRVVVIPYRRFSTTYRSHLQFSRIPEKSSCHLPRGGSLESRIVLYRLYTALTTDDVLFFLCLYFCTS